MAPSANADEELANSTERDAPSLKHDIDPSTLSSCWSRCLRMTPCPIIFLAITSVSAIIGMAVLGVFSNPDIDLLDPSTWNPRPLDDNPHGGDTPYDFDTWDNRHSCRGLELRVINNLDDKWQPYFERAVEDWENGDPDTLTLHPLKTILHDPACEPFLYAIKVCNGDYGETDWVGINHIIISGAHMISSVAIMNDHHLSRMTDAARQNTMCHELGHGFGLGHWDENFYNRNLGNCMDYTDKPEENQVPGRSNFLFLEQMYGNVKGTSHYKVDVNGTAGLHCSSSSTQTSHKLKERELTEEVDLTDEEFSHIAKLLTAELVPRVKIVMKMDGRHLVRNHHEMILGQSLGNGIKIVSTVILS